MTGIRTCATATVVCTCGLWIAGCGSNGGAEATEPDLGVQVPTQEEADATAAADITEENMDEAMAQLDREIEAELNEEE
jgi:4-hydroxy-3-methylbut-2-en-1-yl diphosphate synthase IspG/GcpE